MAKVAIKGHATRGNEVIEILEMLGGKNPHKYAADCSNMYFYIGTGTNNIYYDWVTCPNNLIDVTILTLEDFLERFPYKVGDKVNSKYLRNHKIDVMEWESRNNRIIYKLQGLGWYSAKELQPYTEQKEETMEENKTPKTQAEVNKYLLDNPVKNPANLWDIEQILQNDGLKLPEDVKVNSSGIGCIAFTKWYEKPQYPKTYEECCEVLGINELPYMAYTWNRNEDVEVILQEHQISLLEKLEHFRKLLICRDAYWKIAGDWREKQKEKTIHYVIYSTLLGEVVKDIMPNCIANYLLDFPTEEMRDAFYENFKDLIEECKELL